jgi:hypothetical protein
LFAVELYVSLWVAKAGPAASFKSPLRRST